VEKLAKHSHIYLTTLTLTGNILYFIPEVNKVYINTAFLFKNKNRIEFTLECIRTHLQRFGLLIPYF